jgi:hypothetical protein
MVLSEVLNTQEEKYMKHVIREWECLPGATGLAVLPDVDLHRYEIAFSLDKVSI